MEGIVFGLHIGKESTHKKEISAKGRNQTKERTCPEETLSLLVVILTREKHLDSPTNSFRDTEHTHKALFRQRFLIRNVK